MLNWLSSDIESAEAGADDEVNGSDRVELNGKVRCGEARGLDSPCIAEAKDESRLWYWSSSVFSIGHIGLLSALRLL